MDNAYIYTRVSTIIQVDGFSLDAQEEEIRAYAKMHNINIVGKYSDEGKSGKNKYYGQKVDSLNRVLDDIFEKIDDAQNRFDDIRNEIAMAEKSALTKQSVYEMLTGFSEFYDKLEPEDRKSVMRAIISSIELYKEKRPDGNWVKKIHFSFPITYDGESGALFIRSNNNQDETVAQLVRYLSTKEYVTFKVSPEELHLQNLQVGGTYTQIKDYVFEKFGLKVSTLYIAQIKRKCGLDVGEAYMKPKKEGNRVPTCPPEKEKAIMEALKYYGLI